MLEVVAMCAMLVSPAPTPTSHMTEVHAEAMVAYYEEEILPDLIHERFHCIEALNGPYVIPEPVKAPARAKSSSGSSSSSSAGSIDAPGWIVEIVQAHFRPEHVNWAVRIIGCETGWTWDPASYNPSTATGLMQIKTFWLSEFPGDLWDPWDNVRIGALIFYNYGPQHWACN